MFAVFLLCPARNFRSRSNQTIGCAHIIRQCTTMTENNKCCASMACGWCVVQTLLLTRVAKTTSTWRLSALPTAQEVSDQHFEKQFVLALRDPHLLWYSLPNGLPSSPAQALLSDHCTNHKQFGLKAITSQIETNLQIMHAQPTYIVLHVHMLKLCTLCELFETSKQRIRWHSTQLRHIVSSQTSTLQISAAFCSQ